MHLSCASGRENRKKQRREDKRREQKILAEEIFRQPEARLLGLTWNEVHNRIAGLRQTSVGKARYHFNLLVKNGIIERREPEGKWFLKGSQA